MKLFGRFFGRKSDSGQTRESFWRDLEEVKMLEELEAVSFEREVYVFKHSTRCYISRMVLARFEQEVEESHATETNAYYYLDLLAHREISEALAERYDLVHQSPQLLVLRNGVLVHSASHQSITMKK
ncbi:bacillithiol system redox-active protein YtxJ [Bergeyella sp. RCAD1439]|uniref:bacillithiol system redox-active protein YtxJ n=1 Tax=Bergeyella anatis TaxID=3113737 RepID=UPI002E19E1C1|nr:bacillithiol system redox-active protein YtxJ [Bergeyella sp. RCAD1439]